MDRRVINSRTPAGGPAWVSLENDEFVTGRLLAVYEMKSAGRPGPRYFKSLDKMPNK
jgi:hypothetical protein